MRCPKCSFISFDDLAVCAKCASDLSALSKELNGTCIEARPEFFLGTAIQSPSLDDDNFSDSQVLPPIDHAGINFDDTSTGGFAPYSASSSMLASADLDDSIGLPAEDDVAIELGDIMPIDLDQLDDTSVFSGESLVHTNSFDSGDFALDLDKTETMNVTDLNAVDLDLTGKFSSNNSEVELDGDFSDIDIDDSTLDFANDAPLPARETLAGDESFESDSMSMDLTPFDGSGGINLDDELIAQLVSFNDDLDSTASFDQHLPLGAAGAGDIASATPAAPIDLDDSLVAELTGAFPVKDPSGAAGYSADHVDTGEFELDTALVAELANDVVPDEIFLDVELDELVEGVNAVAAPVADHEVPIEDLTGEFSPIDYNGEPELGNLGLSDIDVADLLESSAEEGFGSDDINPAIMVEPQGETGAEVVIGLEEDHFADFSGGENKLGGLPEDLTGDFLPIVSADDGDGLDDLTLKEIDVSDLLETSGEENVLESGEPISVGEDSPLEVSPTTEDGFEEVSAQDLVPEAAAFDGDLFDEVDDSVLGEGLGGPLGVLGSDDEGLPEIELLSPEDDEEGPPDLP